MAHVTAAPKNGMFSPLVGFDHCYRTPKKILTKTAQSQSSWSDAPPPGSASLICSDGPVVKDVFLVPLKTFTQRLFSHLKKGEDLG